MADGQVNNHNMIYTIIEVANTHGGSKEYVLELIEKFDIYKDRFGIKFQPFSAKTIATEDFSFYKVYRKLEFNKQDWSDIIYAAGRSKDIWLDLFDDFGTDILDKNLSSIYGIKLQSSVLYNQKVVQELKRIDISEKKLIINVAGVSLEEIKRFREFFKTEIKVEELLFEVGFQGYPTELKDSGLSKIQILKSMFHNRIVFADHVSGVDEDAIFLPIAAAMLGADFIEKHVMLDTMPTEYDYYSSLTPERFQKFIKKLNSYQSLLDSSFLNLRELDYLKRTLFKPLAKHDLNRGQALSVCEQLDFRRTDNIGLDISQIQSLIQDGYILRNNISKGSTFGREDFKKATVAVIVACRLKSSRLKEKALKKIGSLTSVEKCLKSACTFENINHVVLATSTLDSDASLSKFTYSDSVIFHTGHPEDVIDRYLGIIEKLDIDIVVRVTADNPFIDNEILQTLLESHFEKGADYTTAAEAALGTNLEIINSNALRRVKDFFPEAEYSEYMTWYFINNPEHFQINRVNLPEHLIRNYRLTLDYEEDLKMFNLIDEKLRLNENDYRLVDIFKLLDEDINLANMNGHLAAQYKVDTKLIETLNQATRIVIKK